MVNVNPEILVWARKHAGLEREDIAHRIFSDSKNATAIEKLRRVEEEPDDFKPTRAQLTSMSAAYMQPLLVFYLATPPQRGDRGVDFRTLPQQSSYPRENALLDILMRNVKAAQTIVRDLLEDDEVEPLHFVGSARLNMSVEAIALDIIDELNFDLDRFRTRRNVSDAFIYLRDCIESRRVFVLRLSDLGSHHSAIPVEVFRGFVFADPIAPFIVINRKDAKSAYAFTALHELAHLWLGASGVSGGFGSGYFGIEQFCNRIARRILMRPEDMQSVARIRNYPFAKMVAEIGSFSKQWKVSHSMIAYSLRSENYISQSRWEELSERFRQDFVLQKQREKEERDNGPDIPFDINRILRGNLGKHLVNLARASFAEGELTPSKAGILLGVPPRRVEAILNS